MQGLSRGCGTPPFEDVFRRRTQGLSGMVFALLGALFIFPFSTSAAPPPNDRPNVLLITIDTVRADHLGCYGYKPIETPQLDALAAAGVRFANAYTPVPITLPAHSVMLTGTYPMRTGMHDFSGNRLNASQPTLATLLHAKGYATGAVVGSAVLDSRFGLGRGFDFYYDHFDFSRLDEKNIDAMMRPGGEVVDRALAWLNGERQKPFLLWVHLYDAHHPYNPPAPYLQKYRSHPYDGGIAFVDGQVGRVVAYLKAKGIYDRTLIVVAGDHGEGLGEHGEKTHGFFVYDSTLHVPLIFKLPADSPKQKPVVDDAANLADILPTILDLIGANKSADIQGRSLAASMMGKPGTPTENYSETYLPRIHFNWSELRGIRFRQYHFIDAPNPELYDLSSDPRELKNLYSTQRAIANEMRKRLGTLIARLTPAAGEKTAESTGLDPALTERLKSLGYVAVSGGGDSVLSDRRLADPKDRIQVYELVSDALDDSQHGRYVESIQKLHRAGSIEKDSLPIHYLLALNYYRQNDSPAAIDEFQITLKLSPDYTLANYYLGLAYVQTGTWDSAIAAFRKTLELDGTNYSAAYNLGAAYLKQGRVTDAEAAFRQSVKINSRYAQAHEALGELLIYQNKLDEGIASLRAALEIEPNYPKARQALIKALQANGQDREAEEESRKGASGSSRP
jgi:arylsulfatase A-like enzyme/Flp pilus assembly protein TadD